MEVALFVTHCQIAVIFTENFTATNGLLMNNASQRNLYACFLLMGLCACTSPTAPSKTDGYAVRIRLEAAAPVMNPFMPSPGYSRYVAANIFQTLGIIDPETLELEPLLATAIPEMRLLTDGPRKGQYVCDFSINPNATWDNGTPVTARDVEFTLKMVFHPLLSTQVWRGYFEQLRAFDMDAADPKKFSVYFEPYYMLALESMCQTPIYPAYHYDPNGRLANVALSDLMNTAKAEQMGKTDTNMIAFAEAFKQPAFSNEPASISGSNAYQLGGFSGNDGLYLTKKENWWGDAASSTNPYLRAYPDTLIYTVVKDDNALKNMLENGELDVALSVNPASFIDMQKNPVFTKQYDFGTRWSAMYTRWMFNLRDPILADKKVRQALAHVVDYDYLIGTVMGGLAARTVGPVNPEKTYYNKTIAPYQYNVEEAKSLLQAAGWSDTDGDGIADKMLKGAKTPLRLQLMTTSSTTISEQTAASLTKSARLAGVELVLAVTEFNKLTAETRDGKFQTAVLAAAQHPGLVELYQNYHSKSLSPAGDNRAGIANPALDQLIDQIRSTTDEAMRNTLYAKAQEIIHDEVPDVYLYAPQQRYIVSKRFEYVLSSNRPGYYEAFFKLKK
jgi:peptide/nickel transport system substrate-binding protein